MKLGLRLLHLHGHIQLTTSVVEEADRLGFESAWIPEHLVLPDEREPSPQSGHPFGVPSDWPWFDPFVYLAHLGAHTQTIRLGTSVYVLALRSPFVAARAIQTLDVVSGGRTEVGLGAGWLRGEWEAVGAEMAGRGERLEEAITVCRKLWRDDPVEHHGQHFDFAGVRFLPKPPQLGGPPLHLGGESDVALRRAARLGDGWIGRDHDPASVRPLISRLHCLLRDYGRDPDRFEITVRSADGRVNDLSDWERAGVTRLLVAPWTDAGRGSITIERLVDGLHSFVARHGAGEPPRTLFTNGAV